MTLTGPAAASSTAAEHRRSQHVRPGLDPEPRSGGGRVRIVEDVTTAGPSISETVPILEAAADVRIADDRAMYAAAAVG